MNVQKMEEQDVNAVCGMVNERLLTSREAVVQLKGLSDRMGLLRPYTHACIRHWRRIGEVWVIGENQGLLAGHFAKNETAFSTICHGLNMMRGVLGSLSKEDRSRLVRNMKQSAGAQNVKWRKQVCGKGDLLLYRSCCNRPVTQRQRGLPAAAGAAASANGTGGHAGAAGHPRPGQCAAVPAFRLRDGA